MNRWRQGEIMMIYQNIVLVPYRLLSCFLDMKKSVSSYLHPSRGYSTESRLSSRLTGLVLFLFFLPGLDGSAHAESIPAEMQRLGNGEVYYLKFIKVYDANLYWLEIEEEKDILSADVSKCLELDYSVDIDKNDFIKAAESVLNRQFTKEQLTRVSGEIETLHQGYRDVSDGDSYTLCYSSMDKVTTLSYNGELLVSVNSPAFAEIYFSIWLGSTNPLDETLRDDLLAGLLSN